MINILKYEDDGYFYIDINYKGMKSIPNVNKIEFTQCYCNKNLCNKNRLDKNPLIFICIDEFKNNLYINNCEEEAFSQIMLEKKQNFYSYNVTDSELENNIYGIYKPSKPFELNKLSIKILDNNGNHLILKYTKKDQFNLFFRITYEETS